MDENTSGPATTIVVGLSRFVDFVLATRAKKVSVARQIASETARGYSQGRDYYLRFRRALGKLHRDGTSVEHLEGRVLASASASRVLNYQHLVRGYLRLWHTQFSEFEFSQVDSPRGWWLSGAISVRVNPELAFSNDKQVVVVKLHLRQEPLSPDAAGIYLHMMQLALQPYIKNTSLCVADVRVAKLHEATAFDDRLTLWLRGEAASLAEIYRSCSVSALEVITKQV